MSDPVQSSPFHQPKLDYQSSRLIQSPDPSIHITSSLNATAGNLPLTASAGSQSLTEPSCPQHLPPPHGTCRSPKTVSTPTRLSTLPASHSHSLSISPLFPSPSLALFSHTLTLSVHLSPSPSPSPPRASSTRPTAPSCPPALLPPPPAALPLAVSSRGRLRATDPNATDPPSPELETTSCKTAGRGQLVPPPHASRGRAANFFQTHNRHSPGTLSNN